MEPFSHLLPSELPRLDLRGVADILIVAGLIYWLLLIIKDTTAVMLVRGLAILVLGGALVSNLFQLPVLGWLIRNSIPALLVAIPILFQPELRRALEHLGHLRGMLPSHVAIGNQGPQIEVLANATRLLSQRRWGALLVLERETSLGEYAAKGVALDAILSVDLIEQIFHPNTRLHDGAAIVRGERVMAAACLLPLAESVGLDPQLGTRHRAALGIGEQTDAVVIVVSEETGQISYAERGHLVRDLDEEQLRAQLDLVYRHHRGDDLSRLLQPTAWRERLTIGALDQGSDEDGGKASTRGTLVARVGGWLGRGSSRVG
jgi:diadenylate cyclase